MSRDLRAALRLYLVADPAQTAGDLLPAVRAAGKPLSADTGNDERPMFAHLKLRAEPIDANALDASPTMRASGRSPLTVGTR